MLTIERLSKIYGDGTPALHEISVQIPDGQFVVVAGPNGAGKSTFLRCINGLIEPTTGRIWLDDVEITAASDTDLRRIRRQIGMLHQPFSPPGGGGAGRRTVRPGALPAPAELKLMLADARVAALERATAGAMMDYLAQIHQSGITVICNLPFPDLAQRYAERILAFRNDGRGGEIAFDGPPQEIDAARLQAIYGADAVEAELR